MKIKETYYFTKIVKKLIPTSSYRELCIHLSNNPGAGDLIPKSNGLRKLRWKLPGRGKRGGARVIYYWMVSRDEILMIYAYSKVKQENLTDEQLKLLRKVVKEEFKDG